MRRLSGAMIILLIILSLFSIVFVINIPTVKAEINPPYDTGLGYWETNDTWTIQSTDPPITHSNKTILVNGGITIQTGGKLTLDNVTLWMNYTPTLVKPIISVDGELIVKNACLVTNYTTNTDRYEFKVQSGGSLTIQSSTVENMG